jgi:D-3-phosphoglycerate dehydrogenase
MSKAFRVGVTRDFPGGGHDRPAADIGLGLLDAADGVEWDFLAEDTTELRADQVRGYDALLVLTPRITTATLEGADSLAIVARFGVGYDTVDVEACTKNGVLVTITPDGVRRPVATELMAFILALALKIPLKDRLTREGRWAERYDDMGMGLTGRTLGVVGLGNIGRDLLTLSKPFEMRHIAYDPYVTREAAANAGAELVSLETLMREADFVCVCCLLNEETFHLVNTERIGLMKPTSYLINAARGPIVDQKALTLALQERRIQGAALDVFEQEPVDPNDPILKLDNVIVTPHALCMTDEGFLRIGQSAIRSILKVKNGELPQYALNPAAADHPRLKARLGG